MIKKDQLKPFVFENLVRVGNKYDGGYVIPAQAMQNSKFLLSLGINADISFDLEFSEQNSKMQCFGVDFTVNTKFLKRRYSQSLVKMAINAVLDREKYQMYRQNVINIAKFDDFFSGQNAFLPLEVAGNSGEGKVTISELVEKCKSEEKHDIFLKMDIEGAEYQVTPDIVKNADRIGYIACEYHDLTANPDTFNETASLLGEHFYPVHIHGNNHGCYSKEHEFPDTIEMTWVNKALLGAEPERESRDYPVTGLDNPCNHKKPDYPLVF